MTGMLGAIGCAIVAVMTSFILGGLGFRGSRLVGVLATVLLSALILHEPMDLPQGIGAVLVLAASLGGELLPTKKS